MVSYHFLEMYTASVRIHSHSTQRLLSILAQTEASPSVLPWLCLTLTMRKALSVFSFLRIELRPCMC